MAHLSALYAWTDLHVDGCHFLRQAGASVKQSQRFVENVQEEVKRRKRGLSVLNNDEPVKYGCKGQNIAERVFFGEGF